MNHADAAEREDIALQLAFELENLNKYTEAIDCLKKILLWNPDNDTALYEIGFCFDASQQIAEGREFFQGFVDLHPYSYIGWYNLGITNGKLNDLETAISCYEFSIAIKEDFSSAYFNKAHCYSQQENYHEALACFNETLTFDPDDALSHYYIGECFEKLKSYDKSISFYKKSLELDEFLADSWFGMGSCYFELDRYLDSLSCLKKATDMDQMNPDYHYLLGDVQAELGFLSEAMTSYEEVLSIDKDCDTILIDIANLADEMGETEKAMDCFCQGVKQSPVNGKLLYNFVGFLLKKGDLINAMFYLDTALKNHYEDRFELFEANEEAKFNNQVIELIEYYKK